MPPTPAKKSEQAEPYYCPGCGRRWNYPTECRGMSESTPHAPLEVVSTDELNGEPEDRNSDAYRKWADGLTPAPDTTS